MENYVPREILILITSTQPGEAHSSEQTLKLVEAQVHAACLGVAQAVKDMQTETGVKDAFTQHWIDDLIECARKLWQAEPQRPAVDIQAELFDWVIANEDMIYNPFLKLKGTCTSKFYSCDCDYDDCFQDLMLQLTRLLRYFTPYSLAS